MDVVYPPVGIAHITSQIPDLIADRMTAASHVRISCAMQPKAGPHFGTGIVVLSAFALARLFHVTFGKPASVLLDMLDNAPARTTVIDGVEYSLCLSHAIDGGHSVADTNTEPIRRLAAWASRQAQIGFGFRRYSEIQAQPQFRHGLTDIVSRPEVFRPLFSPSGHQLRVRPLCPRCGLVDKTARTVQVRQRDGLTLTFRCGYHGSQAVRLQDPAAVIDANTPIRTVLRSLCFSRDRDSQGIETVVLNGGDWAGVWMQRVYFDGLHQLGCCGLSVPFNIFTPQILDDSGAKLSKTIYLTRVRTRTSRPPGHPCRRSRTGSARPAWPCSGMRSADGSGRQANSSATTRCATWNTPSLS
jgi:hypothetical protein